jgi:sugar phosphate permease
MTTSVLETSTVRRVAWRILPFVMVSYFIAFVDRVNVGFAALQMNRDLGLTQATFGLGGGLFFLSYALFEVPSNLVMQKVGARLWIGRIMITWGMISACMAFITGPASFHAVRLLLGVAEAGFFPAVILYITYWFPAVYRARIIAVFMIAIPVSSFLGSPLSAMLLQTDGWLGLHGWQWLFIIEAVPAVLLGIFALFWLQDRPAQARWLKPEQRDWLMTKLHEEERSHTQRVPHVSLWKVMSNRHVLAFSLLSAGSSGLSQCLSIWQPQILKSFGLTTLQTGFINAIPFGLAIVIMILWGRRSDRSGERVWHTVLPLSLTVLSLIAAIFTNAFLPTLLILCATLIGTYAFKGPFWTLTTQTLSPGNAAAGIAFINAFGAAAAFGGTWILGVIKDATGSYPLGLLPLAAICAVGVVALLVVQKPVKITADVSV